MFKKLKDKEVYKKYKKLKDNPQKSAKISLAFWLILFVILILFARVNVNHVSNNDSRNNKQYSVNRYEYGYSNEKVKVFGYYYNSKQLFTVGNEKYYYNGSNVYIESNHNMSLVPEFNLDILKIDYSFLSKLKSGINSVKKDSFDRYIIPLTNFVSLFDGDTPVDLSGIDNYNIIVDEYFEDNNLIMVKVDLSSYYNYRGTENDGILTIDFYNINNINDFTKEYERILRVIK